MKKDTIIDLLVPVIIGLLLVGLALTPVYHGIQWGLYDVLLRLKPSIEEDPAITIVNIDDETIEELNIYPLTRDIMAQGLVTLTEFNAGVIGIDSEFIDKSPRGIREDIITQKIPDAIIDTMEIINGYIKTMASQIDTGQISASEAILEVSISNSVLFNDLFNTSQQAVIDFDNLLGNSARFSNNAHATITPAQYDNEKVSLLTTEQQATIRNAESKDFILDNIALKNIEIIEESPFQYVDFVTPAILPVMMGMVGAGNVRQYVDQDGVRRRVDLLINWEGGYFPHLGFSSVLYYLGYPKLEVYKDKVEIHLEDTLFDPPEPQKLTTISDIEVITIPLDEEGRMIINWIPEPYVDQFQHLSFIDLIHYESDFSELLEDLLVLHQFVPFWNESWEIHPIDLETNWLNALNNGYQINNPEYRTIYQANRQAFLESARIHIETAYKDWREYLEADFLNVDPESLDDESLIQYDLLVNQNLIPRLYQKLKDTLDLHEKISSAVMGNLIIIGYSGQSTTDIGVNPFQKEYMNVGTMANVANMILQNEFVDEVAWYWSFLLILPLTFLITLMFKQLSPTRGALTGLGLLLVIFLGYWGLFVTTGLFMDLAMALLMVGLTFITTIIISFRRTNTQKSFIRDAFGQYLSNDVINELLDNPDKLKLGGENREVTAFFTDVKGFSTIAEQLTPSDLVNLLNVYLTGMSDTVMRNQGTIDKYEGDAIIGFFGAPNDLPNHAAMACRAAIEMKKLENTMNTQFMADRSSPSKLMTRIGINSGEMVVGNMGTEKMKNYTMMGNHVNLAARLEGVNKQYQTWVLLSEYTKNKIGPEFFTRSLDRVRVVGIKTPLRLYELIGLTEEVSDTKKEVVSIFEDGLREFEYGNFESAKKIFSESLKLLPWDGPSQKFYLRCVQYIKNPPANFDGVYNLTQK